MSFFSSLGDFVPHNKRSLAMWKHISQHVDFTDKSVLDAGCGYGDHSFYAHLSGARIVWGVEKDEFIVKSASLARQTYFPRSPVHFIHHDISKWDKKWPGRSDVVMCFSLLPYLPHPRQFLQKVYRDTSLLLLETQYHGDGPGLVWCKDDNDMESILKGIGWDVRVVVGKTLVKGRNKERSIWLCKKI